MTTHLRHSSRVSVSKADPPKQVFRLVDMEVEEVSLVDRPANKRKFLVVKKESDQMATEVTPNGKGGFTSSNGTAKGGAPKDDKEKTGKASLEVPPGFKEMVSPVLTKAAERLQALVDLVGKSKPADVPDDGSLPGVPGEFATELASICGMLDKIGGMWPAAAPELDDSAEGEEPPADAPAPTEMQLRAAEKAVVKGAALIKRADVKKVGAKMSKDRFTRLQQAAQVISNLINELAPTPPTPSGEIGKGKDEKDKAAKADVPPPWAVDLAKSVAGLGTVVKGMQSEVASIKKSRGAPASGSIEVGPSTAGGNDSGEYSWPLDMNNPIRRDGVNKSESFFDEEG